MQKLYTNRRIRYSIAAISASLVLFISGCSGQTPSATIGDDAPEDTTVFMHASYPSAFETIDQMGASVDAIVLGEVSTASSNFVKDGLPFTDTTVNIEKWIKGKPSGAPKTIRIRQTGGNLNGTKFEVEDDPILVAGSRSAFFLMRSPIGTYFIVSGPTGRLPINAATVMTMKGSSLKEKPPAKLDSFLDAMTTSSK